MSWHIIDDGNWSEPKQPTDPKELVMERCSYKDFFCYLMDNHYDLLYEYVVDDMPDEVYGNPSAEEEYLEDLFIKEDKYLYRVLDDIFDDWDMCYEYAERMGWLDD